MTSTRSSSPSLGAMNLRPSALLKTLAILGIFICAISYSYWGRLVSLPANFIHRKPPPSQDLRFDIPTGQNWTKRIWQTSKLPLVEVGDEDKQHVKTWSDLNPDYRYELLTDNMMESYVKDHYQSSHPEIEQIYFEVRDYNLRSNLIRYLILLADGGVYNDLNVGCEQPIKKWVPPPYKDSAGILLGVEVDNNSDPDGKTFTGGRDIFQLVNWTIMSKPNQPFMWFLVKRVLDKIRNLAASQNQPISKMTFSVQDILEVTGPDALTQSFFDYASDVTDSNVTYHNFTKITEPRLIGEVVILPIHAFGAGRQGDGAEGKQSDGTPLIHHYSAESWKTGHNDKAPQPSSVDEEQKKKEQVAKKVEEEEKKKQQAAAEKEKQDAKIAQEAADKSAKAAEMKEAEMVAQEQHESGEASSTTHSDNAADVGHESANSATSAQSTSDSHTDLDEKLGNDQAINDKPASVKTVEGQTVEPDSTDVTSAEPESVKDVLAKLKAEKHAKAKADAVKEKIKAAEAAKEKEVKEEAAAKKAAEEKAAEEEAKEEAAFKAAQENSKSQEEKDEEARKAKEQKEEDERKAKWEEVKNAAPLTAPKKTDEEKMKASNDLTDYDYIPD